MVWEGLYECTIAAALNLNLSCYMQSSSLRKATIFLFPARSDLTHD